MELYLIRHGQSGNNAGASRVADPSLTELGRQQAHCTATWLGDKDVTALYSSPFRRALETATMIGDALGLAPHVWVDLHEWGGVAEERDGVGWVQLPGMNRNEMRALCPNVVLPDDVTDKGWWFGVWNGFDAMFAHAHARAERVTAELRRRYFETEERIALVSHGGFGSTLLDVMLGLPPCNFVRFEQNNCGICKVKTWANDLVGRYLTLEFLNRVAHLPKDAVTW